MSNRQRGSSDDRSFLKKLWDALWDVPSPYHPPSSHAPTRPQGDVDKRDYSTEKQGTILIDGPIDRRIKKKKPRKKKQMKNY